MKLTLNSDKEYKQLAQMYDMDYLRKCFPYNLDDENIIGFVKYMALCNIVKKMEEEKFPYSISTNRYYDNALLHIQQAFPNTWFGGMALSELVFWTWMRENDGALEKANSLLHQIFDITGGVLPTSISLFENS